MLIIPGSSCSPAESAVGRGNTGGRCVWRGRGAGRPTPPVAAWVRLHCRWREPAAAWRSEQRSQCCPHLEDGSDIRSKVWGSEELRKSSQENTSPVWEYSVPSWVSVVLCLVCWPWSPGRPVRCWECPRRRTPGPPEASSPLWLDRGKRSHQCYGTI